MMNSKQQPQHQQPQVYNEMYEVMDPNLQQQQIQHHLQQQVLQQQQLLQAQQMELERLRQVQQQAAVEQAVAHQQMLYYQQHQQQQQQIQPQQLTPTMNPLNEGLLMHVSVPSTPAATTAQQQSFLQANPMYSPQSSTASPPPLPSASLTSGTPPPAPAPQQKAQKRAEHNAVERARRECLNTKFQQLAHSLPNLEHDRRPSKGTIIERTLEYVKQTVQKEEKFQSEIDQLRQANERLISKMTSEHFNNSSSSSYDSMDDDEEDDEDEEEDDEDDHEDEEMPTPQLKAHSPYYAMSEQRQQAN